MKKLREKIRELLPKMYFLDKKILTNIAERLNEFSEIELEKIYQQLSMVDEKTIDHFDKILQKNPRFFEQARISSMKEREKEDSLKNKKELENTLEELMSI